jgi:hypothetical protein
MILGFARFPQDCNVFLLNVAYTVPNAFSMHETFTNLPGKISKLLGNIEEVKISK